MRSLLRPLSWLIGASLALAPLGAGARPHPPERAQGRAKLAGHTVVRWSGVKGMVLDNTREWLYLPLKRMDLRTKGDFAYVSISPLRQPPAENCYYGEPHCEHFQLLYVRDYHRRSAFGLSWSIHDPPYLRARGGPIELYLLADGEATLELKPKGISEKAPRELKPKSIPGRASYVAGGKIVGGMEKLPTFCPTPGCDPKTGYSDRYRVGGKTVDLGRLGYSAVVAYAVTRPGTVPHSLQNQSQHVRACQYPNPAMPEASPQVSDHPWGCDLVGEPTDLNSMQVAAFETYNHVARAATPLSGRMWWNGLNGMRGHQYIGYHAGSLGPSPGNFGAYGIWYRYGVHAQTPKRSADDP